MQSARYECALLVLFLAVPAILLGPAGLVSISITSCIVSFAPTQSWYSLYTTTAYGAFSCTAYTLRRAQSPHYCGHHSVFSHPCSQSSSAMSHWWDPVHSTWAAAGQPKLAQASHPRPGFLLPPIPGISPSKVRPEPSLPSRVQHSGRVSHHSRPSTPSPFPLGSLPLRARSS